jgi:hypothetical protein
LEVGLFKIVLGVKYYCPIAIEIYLLVTIIKGDGKTIIINEYYGDYGLWNQNKSVMNYFKTLINTLVIHSM